MTRAFSRGALVTAALRMPRASIQARNSVSPGTRSSTDSAHEQDGNQERSPLP